MKRSDSSSSAPIDLSVVVPAYNESARISKTLQKIGDYLDGRPGRFEVIVADVRAPTRSVRSMVGVGRRCSDDL